MRATAWLVCCVLLSLLVSVFGQSTELTPGTPLKATSSVGSSKYFKVSLANRGSSNLTVTVTPLGSGDPDLYVDLTKSEPDTEAPYKGQDFGADHVSIPSTDLQGHDFAYIAVHGWTAASFTILATLGDSTAVTLTGGTPQTGTLKKGQHILYKYDVGSTYVGKVAFTPTAIKGVVSLKISNMKDVNDPNAHIWSSSSQESESTITVDTTDLPADKILYALVEATTDAKFSISASNSNTIVTLRDSVPQPGKIEANGLATYQADVASEGCSLTVTATPISGDPDIYIDIDQSKANKDDATFRSLKFGEDEIEIKNAQKTTYYIAITSFEATKFTLLASTVCGSGSEHTKKYTYLLPSVPQSGTLNKDATKYYQYQAHGDSEDVTISLRVKMGQAALYIVRGDKDKVPSEATATWKAGTESDGVVKISKTDDAGCKSSNCTYSIAVVAKADASYTIQAKTGDAAQTLQVGTPISETVAGGKFVYFQLPADIYDEELTISVTVLGHGDPDLFVATNNSKPTRHNKTWASQTLKSDSVTIPHTDPSACKVSPCTYYIGVTGFRDTDFSIVASYSKPISLTPSQPQTASVSTGGIRYFEMVVSKGHDDLTISLQSLEGSQDMYIAAYKPSEKSPKLPESKYDGITKWSKSWYSSVKQVVIKESDDDTCKEETTCLYVIGVKGFHNGTFTITASTGSATVALQNGVPTHGSVKKKEFKYYSIKVDAPTDGKQQELSAIVTATSGDPDLYIEYEKLPTESSNSSRRYGNDVYNVKNAQKGTYYIGVTSWNNASYSVMGLITKPDDDPQNNLITLMDGQPQHGQLFKKTYRYYKFELSQDDDEELLVTISNDFGDPDVYIQKGTIATKDNFTWSSTTNSATDTIKIKDAQSGTYYVTVFAFETCEYALSITTTASIKTLQPSQPVRSSLKARQYRYFSIEVNDLSKPLRISVTPFNGDPDLYVATNITQPNKSNYTWKSVAYRGDTLTINTDDKDFKVGTYYIAVYSYGSTSFSVVAEFSGVSKLVNGQPQSGYSGKDKYSYFKLAHAGTDVHVTVTPVTGTPVLYVAVCEDKVADDKESASGIEGFPDKDNSDYSSSAAHPSVRISKGGAGSSKCKTGTDCSYCVAVYGKDEETTYSLMVTNAETESTLMEGRPFKTNLNKDQYAHMLFEVEEKDVEVLVILTTVSGDADLYINTSPIDDASGDFPTKDKSLYESVSYGADAISIANTEPTLYKISAFAWRNTSFTVTAFVKHPGSNQTTMLIAGQPQDGIIAANEYKYYQYHLTSSKSHSELVASVTALVGDPDLYVNVWPAGTQGVLPTQDNDPRWKSRSFGQDSVEILGPEAGEYVIGVFAFSTCEFSITVSTDQSVRTLQEGVPVVGNLSAHGSDYFQLNVDSIDEDLTISVTSLTNGDPDLFITSDPDFGNITEWQWKSNTFGDDSIMIPKEMLKLQTYYVKVNAFQTCTYTIVSSFTKKIRLVNGNPQSGSVAQHMGKYYQMQLNDPLLEEVSFSLSTTNGRVGMYISTNPDPKSPPEKGKYNSYTWHTDTTKLGVVRILKGSDDHFCANCTYTILVYGLATNSTSYSLVGFTMDKTIALQEGVSQVGHVNANEYKYFSFILDAKQADLSFILTPLSGDPDLYVSIGARPDSKNSTWKSTDYGADVVHVDYTTTGYKLGTYFVGVTGYLESQFSLVAKVTDLTNIEDSEKRIANLRDGIPQTGFIASSDKHVLYKFTPEKSSETVTFSVTPTYGDPDLMVFVNNQTKPEWKATKWGADSLTIKGGCDDVHDELCVYTVKVTAFSHTVFSITATAENTPRMLQAGVPVQDNLDPGDTTYFVFNVPNDLDSDLVISITAISGDPDLYISTKTHNPSSSDSEHEWEATAYGSDRVSIPKAAKGDYYIAVNSWTASSFQVTASFGVQQLVVGEPFNDEVAANQTHWYTINVNTDKKSDLTISLNMLNGGSVQIVANNNKYTRDKGKIHNMPTKKNSTWSTEDKIDGKAGRPNLIEISADDGRACFNCSYFIGVFGETSAAFSISVAYGKHYTTLADGVPFTGYLEANETAYFVSYVEKSVDIDVDVLNYYGSSKVFISQENKKPSDLDSEKSTYRSTKEEESTVLMIPKAKAGPYYTAVQAGEKGLYYMITFATGIKLLRENTLTSGNCKQKGVVYLLSVNRDDESDLIIEARLSENTGTKAGVVLKTNETMSLYVSNKRDGVLNEEKATWKKTFNKTGSIVIPKDDLEIDCPSSGHCSYFINVTSSQGLQDIRRRFTLRASFAGAMETLVDAKQINRRIKKNTPTYFEFMTSGADEIDINLEPCYGNTDMYVDMSTFHPKAGNAKWSSTNIDKVDSTVIKFEDSSTSNSIFIGVFSTSPNAEYNLNVRSSNAPSSEMLPKDMPVAGGDGILTTSLQDDKIIISFKPATNKYDYDNNKLSYHLYNYEDDPSAVMYSVCGAERAHFVKVISPNLDPNGAITTTYFPTGKFKTEKQIINVMVLDESGRKSVYVPKVVSLSASEDDSSTPKSGGNGGDLDLLSGNSLLYLGFAAGLGLVLCCIYFYKKKRDNDPHRGMSALQMQDLQMSEMGGSLRSSGGRRGRSSLLENEDDYDDDEHVMGNDGWSV